MTPAWPGTGPGWRGIAPADSPSCSRGCELFELVGYLLRKYWSPEQIACTLKLMFPHDTDRQVSHEAIYNALYVMPRGTLKKDAAARGGLLWRMSPPGPASVRSPYRAP